MLAGGRVPTYSKLSTGGSSRILPAWMAFRSQELTVRDVLPYLPDTMTIDAFKAIGVLFGGFAGKMHRAPYNIHFATI